MNIGELSSVCEYFSTTPPLAFTRATTAHVRHWYAYGPSDRGHAYPPRNTGNPYRANFEQSHRPWVSVCQRAQDPGDHDNDAYLEVYFNGIHKSFPFFETQFFWLFSPRFRGLAVRFVMVLDEAEEEEEREGTVGLPFHPLLPQLFQEHHHTLTHLVLRNPNNAVEYVDLTGWPSTFLVSLMAFEVRNEFFLSSPIVTATVEHVIASCPRLRSLMLENVDLTTEQFVQFVSTEGRLSHLRELSLNIIHCDERIITHIGDYFSRVRDGKRAVGLTRLELLNYDESADYVGNQFDDHDHEGWDLSPLGRLTELETLVLYGYQFKNLEKLFVSIQQSGVAGDRPRTALQVLDVSYCDIRNVNQIEIVQHSLQRLDIGFCFEFQGAFPFRSLTQSVLTEVVLADCYELTDSTPLFVGLNHSPHIRVIDLSSCSGLQFLVDYREEGTSSFTLEMPGLERLVLNSCSSLRRFFGTVSGDNAVFFHRLEELSLSSCKSLSEIDFCHPSPSFSNTLKKLNVSCIHADVYRNGSLRSLLSPCTALQTVRLQRDSFRATDAAPCARDENNLFSCLQNSFHSLQYLDVSRNQFVDGSAVLIQACLPALTELRMGKCHLSPPSSHTSLAQMPLLQQLDLKGSALSVGALGCLSTCVRLEQVTLRDVTQVLEEVGVVPLSLEVLGGCRELRHVNCASSDIASLGSLHLCRHLTTIFLNANKNMKTLYPLRHLHSLAHLHITDSGVELLSPIEEPQDREGEFTLQLDVLATHPSLEVLDIRGCFNKGVHVVHDGNLPLNLTTVLRRLHHFHLPHLHTVWCVGIDNVFGEKEECDATLHDGFRSVEELRSSQLFRTIH
ncbi:hypothetical protein AGDE_13378 [Angomonas deanei]|nr:hypothetical protein AGDE_13378 [Angomonas deanei]|eukprot:EPY22430.1 hypothetical protein AGDE_13378 [Angomonas deanei]